MTPSCRDATQAPAISGGVSNAKLYLDIADKIGARRVLAKPFTPQELLTQINEVMAECSAESSVLRPKRQSA